MALGMDSETYAKLRADIRADFREEIMAEVRQQFIPMVRALVQEVMDSVKSTVATCCLPAVIHYRLLQKNKSDRFAFVPQPKMSTECPDTTCGPPKEHVLYCFGVMSKSRLDKKGTKPTDEASDCMICLSPPKFPKGRPDDCDHVFCYLCLRNWLKRRSECPLCKRSTKFIVKMYADGKTAEVKVKERTAAHYENEFVTAEELQPNAHEPAVDITIAYARCRVCLRSDNENQLMLCDGVVGHEEDGTAIKCNAAYHCYCLPGGTTDVPDGDWFCPFCEDMLETQRGIYNRRYRRRLGGRGGPIEPRTSRRAIYDQGLSAEQPGPSRLTVTFSQMGEGSSPWLESRSSSESEELEQSEAENLDEDNEDSDDEEMGFELSQTISDSEQYESFDDADEGEFAGELEWEQTDEAVLVEEPDIGYSSAGHTTVSRTRKRRKRTKRKIAKKRRKTVGRRTERSTSTKMRRRKKTKKRKPKKISAAQRRLASAIGVDPLTGKSQEGTKKERRRAAFPSDGIRRGPFGAPLLSINTSDNDELPFDEPEVQNVQPNETEKKETSSVDLVDSIMFEQTKTLAPSFCNEVLRDGSIRETERMAEHRKKVEERISTVEALTQPKMDVRADMSNGTRSGMRKNRSTRWDTPTTSVQNTNVTASIPLPTGPPVQQTISLDTIPVPNRAAAMCPPISPHVALAAGPSSLNTSPSTSFALNALAPPFGMGPSSLCTQPPIGLSSIANAHLGQQQLLQLPPQVFPNLLMQPSFPIGAVNNILAAGLLGNAPIGPPISQAGTPFVFGQMQIPTQNQQLTQQLANLASLQSSTSSQQPRLPLAGVPPPPPMTTRVHEVDVSLEPLAERIRQLTEGNAIRSFGEETATGSGEKQGKDEPRGCTEWGGRKSASAEEEEASDADAKIRKNGPMFDQARQMLSESLKKAYKKKRITKDEYKEIMKKGVTALSQRTKLDEKKVSEYASKYVEYVLRRRKKKQSKEH
ncbi:PHD and RING finger domain-containing protein 1 [Toxocara canis]|uniref:PHD and RING finger domain-containing protein 1 n=2 Tax=Toxocara canis TaxID=6265 RepID=A0A0B2UUB3_TOXCA|nr:PHD and RING finger domain-containing protein 1 [Toxocara canis]